MQYSEGSQFSVQADAARFYPRLLALVKGRFELARISLDSPEYILQLPEVSDSPVPAESPEGWMMSIAKLTSFRHALQQLAPMDLPGIELTIRGGRVKLVDRAQTRPGFELRHIYGRYERHQGRMNFSIDCMSNVFKGNRHQGLGRP